MRMSLAGIVLCGLVRSLAYREFEWNAAAGHAQITLLIVKHVLLTGVFAVGVRYYLRAQRHVKEAGHGSD